MVTRGGGLLLLLAFLSLCHFTFSFPTVLPGVACGQDRPDVVYLPQGYFYSPQTFDNYFFLKPNATCAWTFKTNSTGKVVKLLRKGFDLPQPCSESSLTAYDGDSPSSPVLEEGCGFNFPSTLYSTGGSLHITYKTGADVQFARGFVFFFEHTDPIVDCPDGVLTCRNQMRCVPPKKVCNRVDDCGDGSDEENCGPPPRPPVPCGKPAISPELGNGEYIVGGRVARPNSWPWQAQLRLVHEEPVGQRCGGTLINSQWIVTAAHCFKDYRSPTDWSVYFGRHEVDAHVPKEQLRYMKQVFFHPEYNGFKPWNHTTSWLWRKQNDIALVKLNAPVTFTKEVRHACLPYPGEKLKEGSICHVTGWGVTQETGGGENLKQAAVPFISRKTCQGYFNDKEIGRTMLCAGYKEGGHDACSGDSGGPLVRKRGRKWHLYGVVSTGDGCAQPQSPGIYTEVSSHLYWIFKTIRATDRLCV